MMAYNNLFNTHANLHQRHAKTFSEDYEGSKTSLKKLECARVAYVNFNRAFWTYTPLIL